MPKPSPLGTLVSLANKADKGELDGLFPSVDALLTALSMYRPAQGFQSALDRESFYLQHVEIRTALLATLRLLLDLHLLPPPPSDDPDGMPIDDVLEGLEAWMGDVDAAVTIATGSTANPDAAAELASPASSGAAPQGASGAATTALPGSVAAPRGPDLSLSMGEEVPR